MLEGGLMAFKLILLSRKFLLAASEEVENGINKAWVRGEYPIQ